MQSRVCCAEERSAKPSCCDSEIEEQLCLGLPFSVCADELRFFKWHFPKRQRHFASGRAKRALKSFLLVSYCKARKYFTALKRFVMHEIKLGRCHPFSGYA